MRCHPATWHRYRDAHITGTVGDFAVALRHDTDAITAAQIPFTECAIFIDESVEPPVITISNTSRRRRRRCRRGGATYRSSQPAITAAITGIAIWWHAAPTPMRRVASVVSLHPIPTTSHKSTWDPLPVTNTVTRRRCR